MSIWASVGNRDESILAIDADADDADEYKGTGPESIEWDVAVTWHDTIRFSAWNVAGMQDRIRTMLSIESAEKLRDLLDEAIIHARKERDRAGTGR